MKLDSFSLRKRGFSLTELLVVAAIIAVLAGLVYVGAVVAQMKVHQSHRANNVRQLGMAVQVFVTDNHFYPLGVNLGYFKGANTEHQTAGMTAVAGVLSKGDPVHPTSGTGLSGAVWVPLSASAARLSRTFVVSLLRV